MEDLQPPKVLHVYGKQDELLGDFGEIVVKELEQDLAERFGQVGVLRMYNPENGDVFEMRVRIEPVHRPDLAPEVTRRPSSSYSDVVLGCPVCGFIHPAGSVMDECLRCGYHPPGKERDVCPPP